jgi:glutamate N-acetyltransferase / amino-acid N-acetyltransferase
MNGTAKMDKITCNGFKAAGVAAGLKKHGGKDFGLIFSEKPAAVAGVFTKNLIQAAPVVLDRERITSGLCQAVVVNSGNANCCTGEQGLAAAKATAARAAAELGIAEDHVLIASTGVIGQPLPVEKIEAAVPDLVQSLHPEGFNDLAEAIMTTDTFPKVLRIEETVEGKTFTIVGVAKGAGMIRPDMATMLCFVCSDIQADHRLLGKILRIATDRSFNRITIDGDTSTNDTVLLMANGSSGLSIDTDEHTKVFQQALDTLLIDLAKLVVKDGEGATKLVEVVVRGARTKEDADRMASTIAHSNLVKTAFFGEDANWGRILGAAGRSGVPVIPDKIDLYFDDVMMVKNGVGCGLEAESKATQVLKKAEFTLTVDLNIGTAAHGIFTCDFSVDYVKINADYRS